MENSYASLVLCLIGALFFRGIIILSFSIKIVPEGMRLSVYRLGRYLGDKGPGVVVLIPFIDRGVRKKLDEVERIPKDKI